MSQPPTVDMRQLLMKLKLIQAEVKLFALMFQPHTDMIPTSKYLHQLYLSHNPHQYHHQAHTEHLTVVKSHTHISQHHTDMKPLHTKLNQLLKVDQSLMLTQSPATVDLHHMLKKLKQPEVDQ